jgi:FdhE protein
MTLAPVRIVPQGEILKGAPQPQWLRLPDPASYFTDRAERFRALADKGHADAEFLSMMERLARAQQAALDAHAVPAAVDPARLELCRRHGLPPLAKDGARGPAWREALAALLQAVATAAPAPAQHALRSLERARTQALENMAEHLLAFDYPALEPASVPFLGAALQVHWVKRAAALGEAAAAKLDVPGVCPVCGSPPVASVLRIGIPVPGLRYLHCTLCGTDWLLARGQCSQCESREKIAYFHVEAAGGAVKAEACDSCGGYVKIVNMEQDALVDPVADDLATLALDVLMDESGYQRATPNLLFAPGHV